MVRTKSQAFISKKLFFIKFRIINGFKKLV
nr:MAG TPA: hypothetical protein [Caudoviricetes sp.]